MSGVGRLKQHSVFVKKCCSQLCNLNAHSFYHTERLFCSSRVGNSMQGWELERKVFTWINSKNLSHTNINTCDGYVLMQPHHDPFSTRTSRALYLGRGGSQGHYEDSLLRLICVWTLSSWAPNLFHPSELCFVSGAGRLEQHSVFVKDCCPKLCNLNAI